MLQFMGSQRVRHDWATELSWTELNKFASRGLLYNFATDFFFFFFGFSKTRIISNAKKW